MPPKRLLLDLSLYLVTDSGLLPPGTTLTEHVFKAIRGGATIVQLREKKLNTRDFINLGRELHKITKALEVPLLINDRIDVALAVGCEGVHIGWDDCCKLPREMVARVAADLGRSLCGCSRNSGRRQDHRRVGVKH
jgi:thiamine-phosphate diphosphorylase/hydroxyethylthiazole kinase